MNFYAAFVSFCMVIILFPSFIAKSCTNLNCPRLYSSCDWFMLSVQFSPEVIIVAISTGNYGMSGIYSPFALFTFFLVICSSMFSMFVQSLCWRSLLNKLLLLLQNECCGIPCKLSGSCQISSCPFDCYNAGTVVLHLIFLLFN